MSESAAVGLLAEYSWEKNIVVEAIVADHSARHHQPSTESVGRTALSTITRTMDVEQDEILRLMETEDVHFLILDGGPGTGKSSIAMHRIPYLIDSEIWRLQGAAPDSTRPDKPFFTVDSQLVVVTREHLVPYLYGLAREFEPNFPAENVVYSDKWVRDFVSRYVSLEQIGGWEIIPGDPTLEDAKHILFEQRSPYREKDEDAVFDQDGDGDDNDTVEATESDEDTGPQASWRVEEELKTLVIDGERSLGSQTFRFAVHERVQQSLQQVLPDYGKTAVSSSSAGLVENTGGQSTNPVTSFSLDAMIKQKDVLLKNSMTFKERKTIEDAFQKAFAHLSDFSAILFDVYTHFELEPSDGYLADRMSYSEFLAKIHQQKEKKQLTKQDLVLLAWIIVLLTDELSQPIPEIPLTQRYSHVVIDEAQYLNRAELMLLTRLVEWNGKRGVVTIVGDLEQSASKNPRKLASWDEVAWRGGRITRKRLIRSYRWSKPVFEFLNQLRNWFNEVDYALKKPEHFLVGGGQKPEIVDAESANEMLDVATQRINLFMRSGISTGKRLSIAMVLHPDCGVDYDHAEAILRRKGIVCLTDFSGMQPDRVFVGLPDDVAGLEFDAVFLIGFSRERESFLPSEERVLWMCATRARRYIFLGTLPGDHAIRWRRQGQRTLSS